MTQTEEKTERIYGHEITYYWLHADDGSHESRLLDESDIDHIQKLIEEDYVEGELNQCDPETDEEYRGWWAIKKGG